jgi:16S rRNA (adenine(1408)-N(1))-methyltransferase
MAKKHPSDLVIGVDANADLMRAISHRASRKAARGGLANAIFGRLSLEQAPGELFQLADCLTVLFPWGSLLRAVAVPELSTLRKLAAVARPGARVWFLYGYEARRDARAVEPLGLPDLEDSTALRALEAGYLGAGLQVRARYAARAELAAVPSAWARKMAFSQIDRTYVELRGRVLAAS